MILCHAVVVVVVVVVILLLMNSFTNMVIFQLGNPFEYTQNQFQG